jgi:linoleate 10R-lipoxygenase
MISDILHSLVWVVQPVDFPNWEKVDPTRPKALYTPAPTYYQGCPGADFVEQIVAEFVRVVFRLPGVKRAPGDAGKLVGFTEVVNQTDMTLYIAPGGGTSSFPGTMHLVVSACFGGLTGWWIGVLILSFLV